MNHAEFTAAYARSAIKVEVDPQGVALELILSLREAKSRP